jgi:hypothetical protein
MPYTLVKHSASYTGHADFEYAVEHTMVSHKRTLATIQRLGGLLIESYAAAVDREMAENYPPGVEGLIPRVRGTFAKVAVNGQSLYIPKE